MEIVLGILVLILWLAALTVFLAVALALAAASIIIGSIGGLCIGLFKGVVNYFKALHANLLFEQ